MEYIILNINLQKFGEAQAIISYFYAEFLCRRNTAIVKYFEVA